MKRKPKSFLCAADRVIHQRRPWLLFSTVYVSSVFRWMLALGVGVTLLSGAAYSQDTAGFHRGGLPLDRNAIPNGALMRDLAMLSPGAREKAIGILSRLSFPALDMLSSMRIDHQGAVYYIDRAPAAPQPETQASSTATVDAVVNVDPAVIFTLHSKPSSSHRVYLNFRGERISGTALNIENGVSVYRMKPFNIEGQPGSFSQKEANIIAEVWRSVSEDFSPFDIDVTTERPAEFGPTTAHVLISPHVDANGRAIADENTGGFAYIDVWGMEYFVQYQPALIFPDNLSNNAKFISEAVSHEFGHNLSLTHDGRTSPAEEYYRGHGTGKVSWGPIMGAAYESNVSQWSKGEYAGANNPQDDVALIAARLGFNPDDHGNVLAHATPLLVENGIVSVKPIDLDNTAPANKGVLGKRSDVDYFYFDAPQSGVVALTITPDWAQRFRADTYRGDDADIRVSLYNAAGGLIARSSPPKDTLAKLNAPVSPGRHYLSIEGVGTGSAAGDGYSDYGSLGHYFIAGSVPAAPSPVPALQLAEDAASVKRQAVSR